MPRPDMRTCPIAASARFEIKKAALTVPLFYYRKHWVFANLRGLNDPHGTQFVPVVLVVPDVPPPLLAAAATPATAATLTATAPATPRPPTRPPAAAAVPAPPAPAAPAPAAEPAPKPPTHPTFRRPPPSVNRAVRMPALSQAPIRLAICMADSPSSRSYACCANVGAATEKAATSAKVEAVNFFMARYPFYHHPSLGSLHCNLAK